MKIILREGVNPPSDGKIASRPRSISLYTLQASKSHSFKTPKSEPVTPSGQSSTTPVQSTGTPSIPPGFQMPRQRHLIKTMVEWISELHRLIYTTNNQVQVRLTAIETQLDAIQQKLEESL